jgi:hypothetical protein
MQKRALGHDSDPGSPFPGSTAEGRDHDNATAVVLPVSDVALGVVALAAGLVAPAPATTAAATTRAVATRRTRSVLVLIPQSCGKTGHDDEHPTRDRASGGGFT